MNTLNRIFLAFVVTFFGLTQLALGQLPVNCINTNTLYLNAVNINLGPGLQECECNEPDSNKEYCQIVNIELSDNDINDYSCFGVLLNAYNPYGNEIKVYSSILCEEYVPIYPDLPNRYFIQVSDATPGSNIQVVICKDDNSDIILNADTTPSGLCERNECQIFIDCPLDNIIKPKEDCQYIVGDYRGDIIIKDDCEVIVPDYIVEQIPAPRSIIQNDTIVSIYLYNESGRNRVLIDVCSFKLKLLEDTISPSLQIDTSIQTEFYCKYELPVIGSIAYNNSGGSVTASIDEYEVDDCDGFSATYRWVSIDECGNSTEFTQRFDVIANFAKPEFITENTDIKIQAISNCRFVGKVPLVSATDNCGEPVEVIAKLYNESFNYVGLVSKEIEISDSKAYIIFEAEDRCGNLNRDTLAVEADGILAPELECISELNYTLSPMTGCGVSANWSLPAVVDNCSGVSVKQIQGPKPGDFLTAGNYNVSYEAKDNSGNTSVCSFSINVKEEFVEDFACIDINYSVDQSCNYNLLVQAIFEYNNLACTNLYSVNLFESERLKIEPEEFKDYVGRTLEYELCYTQANYCCSAKVKIEDKLIPLIECQDLIISCLDDIEGAFPQVLNECKEVTWEETIINTEKPCENDSIEKIIYKQWVAVDIANNRSKPCIQKISIKRLSVENAKDKGTLAGPQDTALSCSLIDSYLIGDLELIGPMYKGKPVAKIKDDSKCEFYAYYEDQILQNIDCNMKILRRWSINESNCYSSAETVSFVQFISFMDTSAPSVKLADNYVTLSSNSSDCGVSFMLPEAEVSDNCSQKGEIRLMINNDLKLRSGDKVTLDYGINKVIYTAEDKCGNIGLDTLSIHVIDKSPPVAICLNKTSISLSNGSGWLSAEHFDEGSNDECSDSLLFQVRKMTASCDQSEVSFGDKISFCCSEIGQEVAVILRAIDQEGNWNECMTLVRVVDKIVPVLHCPPNISIDCNSSIFLEDSLSRSINLGGVANSFEERERMAINQSEVLEYSSELMDGYIDNVCASGYQVRERTVDLRNKCGTGSFTRLFELIDANGSVVNQCEQTIVVVTTSSFIESSIIWPEAESVVYGCETNIDSVLNEPTTSYEECTLLGVSFDDQIFNPSDSTEAEEICFKVLRKWEVIDWCGNSDSTIKKWEFDQLIKVLKDSSSQKVDNSIVGMISDFSDQPIVDAQVSYGSNNVAHSDSKGQFTIDNLSDQDVSLSIVYDDNPVDQISALDAFVLQRYLLSNSTLNSTSQLVAADINMDQKIDPSDLAELTKLIIGVDESFSHNKTWRFVPESLDIKTASQLDQIKEDFQVFLNEEVSYINLKGIKIGDIYNANNKQLKTNLSKQVTITESKLLAGQPVEIVLPVDMNDFVGLDFFYDTDLIQVELEGVQGSFSSAKNNVSHTISYYDENGEKAFKMRIVPTRDIQVSELLAQNNLSIKTFEGKGGLSTIEFNVSEMTIDDIELSANTPNPFSFSTNIVVKSEKNTHAIIGISNLQGQIIMQSEVNLSMGENSFEISKDALPGSGIFIYFIRTDQHYASGRMVFINE